ncbi:hypothetical protein V6N13_060133 [Hibiscus sabdariffa]
MLGDAHSYPEALTTVLEIFIFLVDPVYNSSWLQGNLLSTGGGFLYSNELNPPSFPPSEWNRPDPSVLDDSNPKGLFPKNSANMSSAFLKAAAKRRNVFQPLFAILIIDCSLLRVTQDLNLKINSILH